MGTLRKLWNRVFGKSENTRKETTKISQQEKVDVKKALVESHSASISMGHGYPSTPGAFGKTTEIARCKKMYRNRHGKHLKGVI